MRHPIRRTLVALLLLLLFSGCTKTAPQTDEQPAGVAPGPGLQTETRPTEVTPEPVSQSEAPALPCPEPPCLLLDLPLGVGPDQPGWTPSRVGGVSAAGPRDIVVDDPGTSITLLDQAKGRLLRYQEGRVVDQVALPWLSGEAGDLRRAGLGYTVTSNYRDFTIDHAGRILDIRPLGQSADPERFDKGTVTVIGTDRLGNTYQREPLEPQFVVRRISKEGKERARGTGPTGGFAMDWYVSETGGVYVLTWSGGQVIERATVQMILPPLITAVHSNPPEAPLPERLFLGRPLPQRIRLTGGDGVPAELAGEVDLWNLWTLLSRSSPSQEPVAPSQVPVRLTAFFAEGEPLQIELYGGQIALGGQVYTVGPELQRMVEALRLSPPILTEALQRADTVSVAIEDLPGVTKALSPAERGELQAILAQAIAVSPESTPKPLEAPFPRYAIRLSGEGWTAGLSVHGEHHLRGGSHGTLAITAPLGEKLRGWLPVPALAPDDPASLYLADKLEIAPGVDLTRWRGTVVRWLTGAASPGDSPFTDPLTLIFTVRGERRQVLVDATGFSYAGKRYERPGLLGITGLQGVP